MTTTDDGPADGPTGRDDTRPIRLADVAWLAAIGAIGLGLRLAFAVDYAGHPLGQYLWVDEGAYWTRAGEILRGRWLPGRPYYQDPLFPYLLAGLVRLVGEAPGPLRIALAVLGSLTPPIVAWAGLRRVGRAEGIVAGLIAAAYGPLIFTDGLLEKEGLGALLAAVALAATAGASRSGSRARSAIGPGLAWGLLGLVRANALIVGPIGVAWWAFAGPGDSRSGRLARPAWFAAGFAAALAPSTLVNLAVGPAREWIVTTWQGGANFYIGNGPEANGTYVAPDFVRPNPAFEADDFADEAARRAGRRLTPGEVSRFWFDEGAKRWREAPGESARLLVRKLGLTFHRFEIPDNQSPEFVRMAASPRLAWGAFHLGLLLPCAAAGLVRAGRSRFVGFVALATLAGLVSTALFFVVGRYRIPWVPGLALLAGAGIVDIARALADRRWRGVAGRLLLALPAVGAAWRPMVDPIPERWGHAEIALAIASTAAGRLDATIDALDDARALGVGPALRVHEMTTAGPFRLKLAEIASGKPDLEAGISLDRERARRLRQFPEGRAEARTLLDAILQAAPDDRATLRELGAWWLGASDEPDARSRARTILEEAADGPGGDPDAAVLLALLADDPRRLEGLGDEIRPRIARAILSGRRRTVGTGL